MIQRMLSRISVRLLLFNILLVFLPVAGLFSLHSLEMQLLDLQERSMVQQGRMIAAALSSSEQLTPDNARPLIERLGGRSESRIRVVDRNEHVLADSASTPVRKPAAPEPSYPVSSATSRKSVLYRIGVTLWKPIQSLLDWRRRATESPTPDRSADITPQNVVRKALEGRYAATLQESSGQRSLTLYSVLPVRAAGSGDVIGAVVVSQSTSRILRALWRVRLDVFRIFVISVLAAAVLSLLVSATIARPLIRLRDEADDLLDHRGRLTKTFRGSHRKDEIGELTRALEKLTARLERHLQFVESFPADVSHEFKNPLASIRSAAELLARSDDREEKEQLAAMVEKEVSRLNRLLNGVREVSRVDAALDTEELVPVNIAAVLSELSSSVNTRDDGVNITLSTQPIVVAASADRLFQAFRNIVDNAVSFSPPGGRIAISVREDQGFGLIRVDDEGPGIPPEHLERVFNRFFSFRPDQELQPRDHDGLGLAITRAIVEGYGGSVSAMNLTPHGTRIEVRLPTAHRQ